MTSIGVLQIAIFFGLILICTKPLGAFMANLFEGQRTFLHPVLRWLEVLTYKADWREGRGRAALDAVHGRAAELQHLRLSVDVPDAAYAGISAVQSAALQREQRASGPGVQHVDQLRHQHQLAGVRRRIDFELFRADGGACGAELRFRRRRHCDRGRVDSRILAAGEEDHRQFLGGCDARHSVRAAADIHHRRPAVCLAGRDSESESLHRGDHRGRRETDDRAGPGRVAGSHQAAGDEWWRLLQRKLLASI